MKAFLPMILVSLLPSFSSGPAPHFVVTAGRRATPEESAFVKDCLCQDNIGDIFPQTAEAREVMDTMRTVKASISIRRSLTAKTPCSGIYYYKLYSFWPNPKWRSTEYLRGFCLIDKQLIAFSPSDTAANKRLFERLKPTLVRLLGTEKVLAERKSMIAGGIYVD